MKHFKPNIAYISKGKNVYRNKNDICEMVVSDIKQWVKLCLFTFNGTATIAHFICCFNLRTNLKQKFLLCNRI